MNSKRLATRLSAAVVGLTTFGAIGIVGAAPASAGILPTSTSVTASPTTMKGPNAVVTVTATVGPLAVLVTPLGGIDLKVFFPGAPSGAPGIDTGPISLSPCLILLVPCKVTRTFNIPGASPGTYTVVASYDKDLLDLSNSSTGSTTFTVT